MIKLVNMKKIKRITRDQINLNPTMSHTTSASPTSMIALSLIGES